MGIILVASCVGNPFTKTVPESAVKVETLQVDGAASEEGSLEYVASIEESNSSVLSFGTGGRITSVRVKEGQKVAKGQLLATVENSTAQSSFNAAKSTYDQALDAYHRAQQVYDQGSLPEVKWIEIQTKLNQAQSLYESAKQRLDDCKLVAPSSGTIGDKSLQVGSVVEPHQPVMKLLNLSQLYVRMSIPENDIPLLSVGAQASVRINSLDSLRLTGVVEEINPTADALSHTYSARLRLNANPQQRKQILPGMICRVFLKGPGHVAGIELPNYAVQIDNEGGRYVWIVDSDSIVHKQPVEIGNLTAQGVTVSQGLELGSRVITKGMLKVSEGTKVEF